MSRLQALQSIFNKEGRATGFLVFMDHSSSRFEWEEFASSMKRHGMEKFTPEKPTLQNAFRKAIEDFNKENKKGDDRKYWSPVKNEKFGEMLLFKLVKEIAGKQIHYEDETIVFMQIRDKVAVMAGEDTETDNHREIISQYEKTKAQGHSNKVYQAFDMWANAIGALALPNGAKWIPSSEETSLQNFQNAIYGLSRVSVFPLMMDGRVKEEVKHYALADIGKRLEGILEKAETFDEGTRAKTITDRLKDIEEMRKEANYISSMMGVGIGEISTAILSAEKKLFEAMQAKK